MNLNQLEYFVAVADYQSFTKAAEHCYITQTAITQQIKALEEQLNTMLINRSTRPVSLTNAGKVFYPEAKRVMKYARLAFKKTKNLATGESGTLKIGFTQNYEYSDLPNWLISFHRKFPTINLEIYCDNSDQLTSDLIKGLYDLIFIWESTHINKTDQIVSKPVTRVTSYVVCDKNHPLAERNTLKRSDLKGESLLLLTSSERTSIEKQYIKLYENAGYKPNIILNSTNLSCVLMMIACEEGIALVPNYCIQNLDRFPNLVAVPFIDTDLDESIIAAWPPQNMPPTLQHFIDALDDFLRQ
ncbi:LysR family transcriptional regulator [Pseudoramibacter faecis]|uniref:LysR family transcriptional regulator n=1 Tax=Pseudoramibacter faecis TaxID=3108534 RepID=UPI002E7A9155|nr:LysR family transcriptional regulator [Pseudoramibacter sp. HA2172]